MSPPYALDRKGNTHYVNKEGKDSFGIFRGLATDTDEFGTVQIYTDSIAEFNEKNEDLIAPIRKALDKRR